jgi:hypothetical protein
MARRRGGVLGVVGVLAVLALAVWVFRDRIPGLGRPSAVATQVSPEAAKQAQEKLARMRETGDTVHLNAVEFTSLLRYDLAGLTGPLREPSVDFVDNTLKLSGRIATGLLPKHPELDKVRRFLPDTADVMVSGSLRTLRPGHAALSVRDVSFARFPVPAAYYPQALKGLGRRADPAAREDEYPFTLPPGVASAEVEAGELVLTPSSKP